MEKIYEIIPLKVGFSNILNFNYIVIDKLSKQAAIVDPSWDLELITRTCHELDVRLTKILLTHSHNDHVNLVDPIVKQFDTQVYMSAKEIEFYNFKCRNLNAIQDFNTIKLGETQISCLLTPGHTVGGTSYLLSHSLFTGDTVFIEGCGICTTIGGSPEQMFNSIQKIKSTIEPHVRIYPGHSYGKDPGYTMSYLLKNNIYFLIESKEQFIRFRMRNNQKNLFNFK
ncbi:MBL fold metallo-hydrolase [Bacillus wiedmannii]|uniref:MBL fold metallo-hydrolase n=1 Tax=Bacillus wiedmannii TaxID=1890302 RepID=UPI000BF94F07|nr:MBL fold metallo-hydrolase [Bacillus wiedmannii]PEU20728.1 MBL fold metallo-hydrolase [Bacillus wiedmannii]